MKKYNVYLSAHAGASYEVEAENEDEAIELAEKMSNIRDADVSFFDGDFMIEEIEEES